MKKNWNTVIGMMVVFALMGCSSQQQSPKESISGIYPRLAFYNDEGECGTGAVVPWNGDLWAITYGPHLPFGSSDKLYQITPDKQLIVRDESIGGTPANRMIHKESNQLNIGPYFIDGNSNVKVIPWQQAPGRYTGSARHLTDPTNKIYIGTMEEGFYEVDVHTLAATELYKDGNEGRRLHNEDPKNNPPYKDLLPGALIRMVAKMRRRMCASTAFSPCVCSTCGRMLTPGCVLFLFWAAKISSTS